MRFRLLLVSAMLLGISSAHAIPIQTYTFESGPLTPSGQCVAPSPCANVTSLSGMITIGLLDDSVRDYGGEVTSFMFTDGVTTITEATTGYTRQFIVGTTGGAIDFWLIDIFRSGPTPPVGTHRGFQVNDVNLQPEFWFAGTTYRTAIGNAFGRSTERFDIVTKVPEPGTLALLGAGLLGMAFARRRIDQA